MNYINLDLGVANCENFNDIYFQIHKEIYFDGKTVASRNGNTKEVLAFKTIINKPYNRCVGGYGRDVNIFFLLAEALWIFAGRRDVAFLDIFNSQLKNYSDDGRFYYAPYGWRMRNWGLSSMEIDSPDDGLDQIAKAVYMLDSNPDDRRVVVSIWNPYLDLATVSKDLPCNDLLMFKIRNQHLHLTIANRSNDLNLGLTTNLFQFSFITEIMARVLDVNVGRQIHNSDSLHLYVNQELTTNMQTNINKNYTPKIDFYEISKSLRMDFNFKTEATVLERLKDVDFNINSIIMYLLKLNNGEKLDDDNQLFIHALLPNFSKFLTLVNDLLTVYVKYKTKIFTREESYNEIYHHAVKNGNLHVDFVVLALNFFAKRIKNSNSEDAFDFGFEHIGKY